MDILSSDSSFLHWIVIWWLCDSHVRITEYSEKSYLGCKFPKRSITWITQRKATVWCAVLASGVLDLNYYEVKSSEEAITIKSCTLKSSAKLSNSYRMLFPCHRELLLTLHGPSVVFTMKCLRVHQLDDMLRQVGQPNYPTQPHRTFPSGHSWRMKCTELHCRN